MANIVGISTCKGRLEHVKQSSKSFIESSPTCKYLLVDYKCPEKTGDWVLNNYSQASVLFLKPDVDFFNKPIALNSGAKFAINNLNADYLLFFDSDSLVKKGFIEKIIPILNEKKFIIVKPSKETLDLTGFIIVPVKIFKESKGYEESFRGWGAEDLEFRLRLYAKHNYDFTLINGDCLGSITHNNDLRTIFYNDKDKEISNKRNWGRMCKMFEMYREQDLNQYNEFDDREKIEQLLGF